MLHCENTNVIEGGMKMSNITTNWTRLAFSLGICLGAGGLGSVATRQSLMTWYPKLIKPFFSPPDWIFAPVWTTLYLMMGYSAYLVWQKKESAAGVTRALSWFGIQLFINISWSFVFFKFQSLVGGVLVIMALWSSILLTIVKFTKISKKASSLLMPYLLWVSFAAVLNVALWRLNK